MMTSTRKILLVLLLIAATLGLMLAPAAVQAQGPGPGDKIIFGSSFTLASGETLDGNLVVFGGSVRIQQNARVRGNVSVIGGAVTIHGVVEGDVVSVGGAIRLGPTARVFGDATAIGGVIDRDPGAEVRGNIVETQEKEEGMGFIGPGGVMITPVPDSGYHWNFPIQNQLSGPLSWVGFFFTRGMAAIAWTAILAALGVVLLLLAPRPTERVATSIKANPLLAFAVGFGVSLLVTIIAIPIAFTICLIPVSIALLLGLTITMIFGWLAFGWMLGRELLKAFSNQNATPIWEMIVGVAVLTLLWRLPTLIPWIGGFASFLVLFVGGNIALGAVVLTRFGSRDYPATPAPTAPPPPPETSLPEHSQVPPAPPETPDEPKLPPPPPPGD
jgi:cytoskeletal protein CcmA (bactofilin family)